MRKYHVYLRIQGPAGEIEAPTKQSPYEAESFTELLHKLADNLPYQKPPEPGKGFPVPLALTGLRITVE